MLTRMARWLTFTRNHQQHNEVSNCGTKRTSVSTEYRHQETEKKYQTIVLENKTNFAVIEND